MFNTLLPRFIRRKIASGLDMDTGPFNRPIDDIRLIPIQPNSYLAIYYKRYGGNFGPGVSLYVHENEVLRFDCFGKASGHYHSLPCLSLVPGSDRIDFSAETVEAQVQQIADEITLNHVVHLGKHFRQHIREYRFDQVRLAKAVAEAQDRMLTAHLEVSSTA